MIQNYKCNIRKHFIVLIKEMEILIEMNILTQSTNAWMDSFRSILNRFGATVASWLGFNYLAFIVIA
ncbi:hypothetical protein AR687_21315 [Flavobacteriaceae bacterium CRH]|nr:hypothetical protein AR687_21315 [Flavobacteriaceae bacterium CRH]